MKGKKEKMKTAYPIVLIPVKVGFVVYVPDFDINTEGDTMAEAIEMARDAIGIVGIDFEDDGKALPVPSNLRDIKAKENEIVSLVDIDFTEYRRKNDTRAVKKNCTLPSWLNEKAEAACINFSSVLQEALKQKLNIK